MDSKQIRRLVAGTADAAFAVDPSGLLRAWNGTAEEFFGLSSTEANRPEAAMRFYRGVTMVGEYVRSIVRSSKPYTRIGQLQISICKSTPSKARNGAM